MTKLKLEFHGEPRGSDAWIYTLSGDLFGSSDGYDFQEEVREKIASGVKKIVLELSAIRRMDSSGIGILTATMWSASQAGAGLMLAAISPQVEKVLSIVMLLEHIGQAETVEQALVELDRMGLE